MINNAGVGAGRSLLSTTDHDLRRILDTNLYGPECCGAATAYPSENKQPRRRNQPTFQRIDRAQDQWRLKNSLQQALNPLQVYQSMRQVP
ncbi:hypothetical protein [Nocardia gipuzkoensis]|uniref:hypothetical protein n=1 Tax=Nocardia gipuzkoensis TaxID=2749991 RepID=UPI003EE4124B